MGFLLPNGVNFPVIGVAQQANWCKAEAQHLSQHAELDSWLQDPQSLTAKLKQHSRDFQVIVIGQQPGIIRADEATWLGTDLTGEHAIIREVLLCCDGQPWVFARSVFPASAMDTKQLQLGQLGDKPLGAHLFAQPDLQRSAIEVCCFADNSVVSDLNQQLGFARQQLWGRRSCFTAAQQQVLVAEVFIGASIPAQLALSASSSRGS